VTLGSERVGKLFEFHQAHIEWYVANLIDRAEAQLRSSEAVARTITRATLTVD
jgi:hypothetical protein